MHIKVFTDGSATSEGKPGGYGYCIVVNDKLVDQGNGYMESASNNDAELEAAIQGLSVALLYLNKLHLHAITAFIGSENIKVTLVSDSKLILGWASGEYKFKQEDKIDKYHKLQRLMEDLKADTEWVKGHSGDPHNELCDQLANAARLHLSNEIALQEKKAKGDTLIGRRKTGVICLYYEDKLKVVDLKQGIVEDYSRDLHGARGGIFEVREEKSR